MKTKKFKNFADIVDFSVEYKNESQEFDCDLILKVDGVEYKAHTASVCNRDILFYCDKACLYYVVDSYGSNNIAELVNIEECE